MNDMPWGRAGSYPELYEQLAVPAFFGPFADDLVERAALAPGVRVLDVATGTGAVARRAAAAGARVTALDLTDAMLDVARGVPGGESVTWVQGDALDLPFEDEAFDVVLCQQGLQFLPDLAGGLGEMRRVLAPGGRLLGACWDAIDRNGVFASVFEALAERVPDVAAVARTPFAMTADRLAGAARAAGLADVEVGEVTLGGAWASTDLAVRTFLDGTPMALVLATRPPDEVAALRASALERVTAIAAADGTVTAPMTTHLLTATA